MIIDFAALLSKMDTYEIKEIKALVDKELLSRGYGEPLILTEAEKDMIEKDIIYMRKTGGYNGTKIEVIKLVRNRTACMLKDAKAIVDDYYYRTNINLE